MVVTVRAMRVDGGDSLVTEGSDCWGSRAVEINTITRSTGQILTSLGWGQLGQFQFEL